MPREYTNPQPGKVSGQKPPDSRIFFRFSQETCNIRACGEAGQVAEAGLDKVADPSALGENGKSHQPQKDVD